MNFELLKDCLQRRNISVNELAYKMGIDRSTFYRKARGDSDFYRKEIQVTKDMLNLTSAEVDRIFFGK